MWLRWLSELFLFFNHEILEIVSVLRKNEAENHNNNSNNKIVILQMCYLWYFSVECYFDFFLEYEYAYVLHVVSFCFTW